MIMDSGVTPNEVLTYREALREVELLRKQLAAALHQRDEANALSDENVEKLRSMERMECKVHGSWHPVFDGACIECLASALSSLEELRIRYVNSYCDLEGVAK
jgi:hypothetical protein